MMPQPSLPSGALRRHRFLDGLAPGTDAATWAHNWLRILLAQDGSATLLCETIAHDSVRLDVTHQTVTRSVPADVREHLAGDEFIERQVCLSHRGEVMMDNLTYIALSQIDPALRRFLDDRTLPIGHLFNSLWTRKHPLAPSEAITERMWTRSGVPDPQAVRAYLLQMPESTCMLITETFRAGMRWGLPDGG